MPDPVCVLAAQFFLMGSTASEQLQMLDVIICLSSLAVGESCTQLSTFKWLNTMLGNIKNAFHAIRKKHVPRYLAEFEYCFNRRFNLPAMIERLLCVALCTPMPYRLLRMAEVYG